MLRTPSTPRSPLLTTLIALATLATASAVAMAQPPQGASEVRLPERARQLLPPPPAVLPDLDLAGPARVDAPLAHLTRSVVAQRGLRPGPGGEEIVPVLLRGPVATAALRAMGVDVQTEAGEIRTARVPLSALPALVRQPGVERLTLGYGLRPQLDVSVPETRADDKRSQTPPLYGWYGRDVVVGVVDSGFDYQHDDFRNPDGSTRFHSIWDQNSFGTPPSGFGYGNECSAAQIGAGTCSQVDADGHGSHVMGIAAGDGSATGNLEPQFIFTGMANGATLIGVATDFSFQGVIDGVSYIFQKAAALGRPAVVNLSLGTGLGPHDGTTDFELALNSLTGPGKIVVASAGNAQQDQVHASKSIQSAAAAFSFSIPGYTPYPGGNNDAAVFDLWHDADNSYAVRIKRPSSSTLLGPVNKGAFQTFSTTDGYILVDYQNTNDPNGNGQSEIYVEISDALGTVPRAGAWQVELTPVAVPDAPIVHAWSESFLGYGTSWAIFTADVDTTVIVGMPATADSLIAAASYTSKRYWASLDGNIYNFTGAVNPYQISPYSARGPRRDGVLKPDITAPGSAIVSVLSADSNPPWPIQLTVPDGVHLVLQGTSMSAPHVAGAVAMLLQKTPALPPAAVKAQLASAARYDPSMGTLPNPRWGAGKLDLGPLICSDIAPPVVTVTYPTPGLTLYVGTEVGLNWTAVDDRGVESVDLEYRVGAAGAWTPIASGLPNLGYHAWTVPDIITDEMQIRVTAHDCVNPAVAALGPFVPVRAPSVGVPGDVPVRFAAYHPAPNPFSQAATLRFDLPAAPGGAWPVDVSVFNIAGRKVKTVVQGPLAPGRYAYEWDGRDDSGYGVSAGIYFVRVTTGAHEAKDRLIYLP